MPDRKDHDDPTDHTPHVEGASAREPAEEAREAEGPGGRFRKLGRRFLGQERVSAREVMGAVLEGGDKAKTEIVKAVAREVRSYLEELGLREFMTDYSLEVRASFNLRKLTDAEKGLPAGPAADTAPERSRPA